MTEIKHQIRIDVPALARVEGEGALDLTITDGCITDLKLRIYEPPRYFEKFLEGRMFHEVPDIVARICGICPVAYQMSAVQALESVFDVKLTPWIQRMRRVLYCGEWIQSHSLHIHLLALPDYLGFNNIIELASAYPAEAERGMRLQALGNDIMRLFGGRSVHPVGVVVGGFSAAPKPDDVARLCDSIRVALQDAEDLLDWLKTIALPDVAQDFVAVAMCHATDYPLMQGDIGTTTGLTIQNHAFAEHFSETQVPHSTALHCHLQGQSYLVGPLARLNLNYQQLPAAIQQKLTSLGIELPSNNMFHSMIARAVEIWYALGEALRLLSDYQRPQHSAVAVTPRSGTGFGCTEAPRGILWHRYQTDDSGRIVSARIVPPTSQNQARIEEDIKFTLEASGLDQAVDQLRLLSEKVIRNYDPCISCATHFLKLTLHEQGQQRPSSVSASIAAPGELTDYQQKSTGKTAIVGVGSAHGADRLGYDVVQQLNALSLPEKVVVKYLDHFDVSSLAELGLYERIIFVDAVYASGAPGRLIVNADIQPQISGQSLSSHALGLREMIIWIKSRLATEISCSVIGLTVTGDTAGDSAWMYQETDVQRLVAAVVKAL